MGKSAADKPSKKRKAVDTQDIQVTAVMTEGEAGFQPDPQFKRIQPEAMADFSGVENGTSELWLIQMPRSVQLDTVNDTDISVEQHGGKIIVKGSIASTLPTKDEDGVQATQQHTLLEEGAPLGREHYCLAPSGTRTTLTSLPISRRFTLVNSTLLERAQAAGAIAAADQQLAQQQEVEAGPSSQQGKKRKQQQQDSSPSSSDDDGDERPASKQPSSATPAAAVEPKSEKKFAKKEKKDKKEKEKEKGKKDKKDKEKDKGDKKDKEKGDKKEKEKHKKKDK